MIGFFKRMLGGNASTAHAPGPADQEPKPARRYVAESGRGGPPSSKSARAGAATPPGRPGGQRERDPATTVNEGSEGFSTPAGQAFIHPPVLETEEQLAQHISFSNTLFEELELSAHIQAHICPLEVAPKSKSVIILVVEKYLRKPELVEVFRILAQRGYKVKAGPLPNIFVVDPAQLLAIAKQHITAANLSTTRRQANSPADSALINLFYEVVGYAVRENASDIHVNIYTAQERSEIKFSIADKYVGPDKWKLPTVTLAQMLGVVYQKAGGQTEANFIPTIEQQCRVSVTVRPDGRTPVRIMLRWASMSVDHGSQVTMRLQKQEAQDSMLSLEQLGYLPTQVAVLKRAMNSKGGAIIFSGVVNSGKSTTIATVLGKLPHTHKVMTIEDPVELLLDNAHQKTIARPLDGSGDTAFNSALSGLKRAAYHDLYLGEIRDAATGIVAQDVIQTGQNLYTTTHAQRALLIPDKLASPTVGIERTVLATPGNLKLLVYQALLPVNCPSCKIAGTHMLERGDPTENAEMGLYLGRIKRLYNLAPSRIFFRNTAGCERCRRDGLPELNGLKGRTVVSEMVEPDAAMLGFIARGDNLGMNSYVSSLPRSAYDDPSMENKSTLECAIYKMSQGMIDPREIEPRFADFETIEIRRNVATRLRRRAEDEAAALLARHAGAAASGAHAHARSAVPAA